MARPVEFVETTPNNGFDAAATPRWQMVPVGGSRTVRIRNAPAMALSCSKPGLTIVDPGGGANRTITLHGVTQGTYLIEVNDSSGVVGQLEVAVKPRLDLDLGFFFVHDNTGKANHATRRTIADIPSMMQMANDVFGPQANVFFHKKFEKPVTIQANLGRKVVIRDGPRNEWEYLAFQADQTVRVNVFFVRELEDLRKPGEEDALTEVGYIISVLEDRMLDDVNLSFAHELGHALGVDHEDGAPNAWLMVQSSRHRGRYIPKQHALKFNP